MAQINEEITEIPTLPFNSFWHFVCCSDMFNEKQIDQLIQAGTKSLMTGIGSLIIKWHNREFPEWEKFSFRGKRKFVRNIHRNIKKPTVLRELFGDNTKFLRKLLIATKEAIKNDLESSGYDLTIPGNALLAKLPKIIATSPKLTKKRSNSTKLTVKIIQNTVQSQDAK